LRTSMVVCRVVGSVAVMQVPRSTAQLDVRCGVRIPSTGLPDANIRVAASADPRLR
jgi:hypothetical protein